MSKKQKKPDKFELFEEVVYYIMSETKEKPNDYVVDIIFAVNSWDNLEDIIYYSGLPGCHKKYDSKN